MMIPPLVFPLGFQPIWVEKPIFTNLIFETWEVKKKREKEAAFFCLVFCMPCRRRRIVALWVSTSLPSHC